MESKKATSVLSDIMQKLSSIGKPEEVKEEVVELSEEVTETEVKEEEVVEAASTEEPKEEPKANKYEEYCALSGNDKTSFFAKHKDEIIEDMKKEK